MVGRARPAGTEIELARAGARQRDELLQGLRRHRRVHEENVFDGSETGDRGQLLHVVLQVRVERRAQRDRRRAHEYRVAVRHRLGRRCDADVAARAGPVVGHDVLTQLLAQLLAHRATDHVARRPGRKRQDEPYRLARVTLTERSTTGQCSQE
jgi:hypothetical protein